MNTANPLAARIIYISCGLNGMFGLSRLIEYGYWNIHIITIGSQVAAKAQVSGYVEFNEFANAHQLSLHCMETYSFYETDEAIIRESAPDVILVNGWNRIVPARIFNLARHGGYGVHAGHPPRGRGRAPVAWTLIKGLRDLEVYIFQLTEQADAGKIIGVQRVEVTDFDTAQSLYDKIALAISILYLNHLPQILMGNPFHITQDDRWATEFPKRGPADGLINWQLSDWELYNFIRGQSQPYPGAFTFYQAQKLFVWDAVPFDRLLPFPIQAAPGEILNILTSDLVVRTGTSPLLLRQVQFAGETTVISYPFSLFQSKFNRGDRFG
jgi:methionyl-tRNA formyltransferase